MPVTKGGDPSLEYCVHPGVLTLSLIQFSIDEPKGQPHWVAPELVFKINLAHLPSAKAELSVWQQLGARASGDALLANKEQNNLFLFSLFLDCPCSSLQASCFCCVWKGLWFQFSCIPHACPICHGLSHLPWQGVCSSSSSMLGNSLCFSLLF